MSVDITECDELVNVCHNCTNTVGSYSCSCDNGYNLINGSVCKGIINYHLMSGCIRLCKRRFWTDFTISYWI